MERREREGNESRDPIAHRERFVFAVFPCDHSPKQHPSRTGYGIVLLAARGDGFLDLGADPVVRPSGHLFHLPKARCVDVQGVDVNQKLTVKNPCKIII